MAKVVNPLMSTSATGSIGKSLIYTSSKKRGIVKGFFVSNDKSTADQLHIRSVFNDGVQAWHNLTAEEKEVYNEMAKDKTLTGYNIFIKEYLNENLYPPVAGRYESGTYENCLYSAD